MTYPLAAIVAPLKACYAGIRFGRIVEGNREAPSPYYASTVMFIALTHFFPSKPDTVEKLLTRISESSVGEEVIAAILRREQRKDKQPSSRDSVENQGPQDDLIYSPLQILAAAVEADRDANTLASIDAAQTAHTPTDVASNGNKDLSPSLRGPVPSISSAFTNERLAKYFAPRTVDRTDWEMLASTPLESTFKLDAAAFDPVSARLVSDEDISRYFDLFFAYRNPLVGLLDPILHTPEFVRGASFTLFSVVCAAGCAMSTRQRDRLLYPALASLSEENIKWSIGIGVRSVETIQAIIYLAYTAPASERQCDDPYWLRVTHATQLARELGLNRPSVYTRRINNIASASPELRQRLLRNVERTWLYSFLVDKSFGVFTGRVMSISWREIRTNVSEWWKEPYASPLDRLVCGLIEMRVQFIKTLEDRPRLIKSAASVLEWQIRASSTLHHIRNTWCEDPMDDQEFSLYLPIMKFYMTSSLLVMNGQALRHLIALEHDGDLVNSINKVSRESVDTAVECINMLAFDSYFRQYLKGITNTAFIQACHCSTEILLAIKRSAVPNDLIPEAGNKIRLVAELLEGIARQLPASSWASIYASLSRGIVQKFNEMTDGGGFSDDVVKGGQSHDDGTVDSSLADSWWRQPPSLMGFDGSGFDFASVCGLGLMPTDLNNHAMFDLDFANEMDSNIF